MRNSSDGSGEVKADLVDACVNRLLARLEDFAGMSSEMESDSTLELSTTIGFFGDLEGFCSSLVS